MYRIRKSKLSISRIRNEIMFVYWARNDFHVKKLTINSRLIIRSIVAVVGISSFVTALIFTVPLLLPLIEQNISSNEPYGDEIKEEILQAEETDFTEENPAKVLTVTIYKVKKGDTLSHIAAQFGVSKETICGSSGLTSYDLLKIGQTLRIPDRDGMLIKVKNGVTLVDLAKKYKIPLDKIIANNQLLNPDFLPVGNDIFLPDAKPQNIVQGFIWPTISHLTTSAYGWRRHPISGRRKFHTGMDIRSRYQRIKASKYGKVTFAGRMGGYGRAIIIAHPSGFKTLYAHLSRIIVKRGQYVRQGQQIAKSGNSGYSAGPHLHFEIIKNGKTINPRRYLKK